MEKIDKDKTTLINKAKRQHKKIYPCARSGKFQDCFTSYDNTLYFWFDTEDHNTRVVCKKI